MSVPQDKLMELMGGPRSAGTSIPATSGLPQPTPDAETPPMGHRCQRQNLRWVLKKHQ